MQSAKGTVTLSCFPRIWTVLLLLVLGTTAAGAGFPEMAGPGFLTGDVGVPGESIGNQEHAQVAAGGSGFLAVWTDMRTSYFEFQGLQQNGRDVYAALLDANGAMVGTTPIIISQDVGSQQEPEVAWNGQNWLVIWEHEVPSTNGGAATKMIYGVRIAPDGTLLETPFAILEAPQFAGSMTVMEVVANGSEWLVAGQADTGGGLRGVRVAADGTLLDSPPVSLLPGTGTQYGAITIVSAQGEYLLVGDEGGGVGFTGRRFMADLTPRGSVISLPGGPTRIASNGTEYYVTWDPAGGLLRGSRMTLNGTMLDPGGIALMESDYWDGDDSDVTWDGNYWWVFHMVPYPDGGLHFVRVATDGTLVDSTPVYAIPPGVENDIGIYTSSIVGGPAGGVQMVWADMSCNCPDEWSTGAVPWDVHSARISADAQVSPPATISCSGPAQTNPDLTVGPDGFLSLYVSEVDEVQRIMARRLDPLGNPRDEEPTEIASGSYVTNPEAAWNGSVYLITWDEFFYCVGGDWPPCGSFIHAVRMLADGTVIDPEPIVVMPAWEGDVAALGENFLVVGRYFGGSGDYVFPFAMRVDGSTGELMDAGPFPVGGNFAVHPRVTAFAGKWLVVWEQKVSHDESWGASRYNFVGADGSLKFEPILGTQGSCYGGRPEVAASATSALVVCRERYWGHHLNDINAGLILADETLAAAFEVSGAVEAQRAPTVAFDGANFLVVWEDMRNAVDYFDHRTDLYGARVTTGGALLDPLGVPLAVDARPEQQPALASAGGDTLLAASIFNSDPGLTSYRLGIFHADGQFTDPPAASFGAAPKSGCFPLEVDFADQSLGGVSSWDWDFGDGATSAAQNPSHVYTSPGVYSVTMTAANSQGGFDTAARFNYITAAEPTRASFTSVQDNVCAPLGDVQFTDQSDGFPDSWIWDFGDGSYSTEQHPSHTYLWPGTYTVTLTVAGSCGSDAKTIVDLVQVDPPCEQIRLARSDMPVAGTIISGDYTSTWVYDTTDFELFYEDIFNDGAGSYSKLEHWWDFEVPAGDVVRFHANTNASETEGSDWFRFEYSTDGVDFTPLVDVPVGFATLTAPMPSNVSGTVYIRIVDNDQASLNYLHHVSIDFLSIDSFVPMPDMPTAPVVGLSIDDAATISWSAADGATHYDIMRGSIASLHANASVGDATCAEPEMPGTNWTDGDVPPSGSGFYYIIRGRGEGRAPGTFDNPGPPPIGWEQRDAEIGSSGGASCPVP